MRHMYTISRPFCELESSVEAIGEATRTIYGDIDCASCLRRAIAETEERARVLRELLGKAEVGKRCRVYDAACINPSYCDARDACCAGDPDCVPLPDRGEASS